MTRCLCFRSFLRRTPLGISFSTPSLTISIFGSAQQSRIFVDAVIVLVLRMNVLLFPRGSLVVGCSLIHLFLVHLLFSVVSCFLLWICFKRLSWHFLLKIGHGLELIYVLHSNPTIFEYFVGSGLLKRNQWKYLPIFESDVNYFLFPLKRVYF